jgi:hypothetical protein
MTGAPRVTFIKHGLFRLAGFRQLLSIFEVTEPGLKVVIENKVIAEVRYVGLREMKTVGEGFIALGDLLKKAEEETQP